MKTVERNTLLRFQYYLISKNYSEKTIKNIIHAVGQFIRWAAYQKIRRIANTTYADMLLYIRHCNEIKNQRKTIYLKLLFLRYFFDCLIKEKRVKENPVANIRLQGLQKHRLHDILLREELDEVYCNFPYKTLTERRNKVILGLLVFQGLRVEEIKSLLIRDINLREAKLVVAGERRNAERTLKLQSQQIMDLSRYLRNTRKIILQKTNKSTDRLIVSLGKSYNTQNTMRKFLFQLTKMDKRIKNFDQVRTSVITHWIKQYNLREVQYMSGHKYVSSTEIYKANNLDGLINDIGKFHPL